MKRIGYTVSLFPKEGKVGKQIESAMGGAMCFLGTKQILMTEELYSSVHGEAIFYHEVGHLVHKTNNEVLADEHGAINTSKEAMAQALIHAMKTVEKHGCCSEEMYRELTYRLNKLDELVVLKKCIKR